MVVLLAAIRKCIKLKKESVSDFNIYAEDDGSIVIRLWPVDPRTMEDAYRDIVNSDVYY